MISPAVSFAVLLPALLVAHQAGDYWAQTDQQAVTKSVPGAVGRWACADHVVSYTALTSGTVVVLWGAFGLPISMWGFLAGQMVSAVTHYWADRRFTLERLANRLGKGDFYRHGLGLASGAHQLDQAWHWWWLGVAAFLTAVL